MRKILSLVLVATMLVAALSLASCTKNEPASTQTPASTQAPAQTSTPALTTFELLSSAIAKTTAMKSIDVKFVGESKSVDAEEPYTEKVVFDYIVADKNAENSDFYVKMSTETEGMSMELSYCFKDKVLYMDAFGMKLKVTEGEDGYEESVSSDDDVKNIYDIIVVAIPEDLVKTATVTKDGGKTTIAVAIPDDRFAEVFKKMHEENNADEENKTVVKNMNVEIVVNENGYLEEYNIKCDEESSILGLKTSSKESYNIKFNKPGVESTVSAPADAADYKSAADYEDMIG